MRMREGGSTLEVEAVGSVGCQAEWEEAEVEAETVADVSWGGSVR